MRFGQQGAALFESLLVAPFLIARTQLQVALAAPDAELLDRCQRLLLEAGLASEQMIEPARDLPRHLDVGHLVLPDRDQIRAVDQDVGRLHQRVAEKSVGR